MSNKQGLFTLGVMFLILAAILYFYLNIKPFGILMTIGGIGTIIISFKAFEDEKKEEKINPDDNIKFGR